MNLYKYHKNFKKPKTTKERRQYYACEIPELIRGRRKPECLPNYYDDVYRHIERSWKFQSRKPRQHGFDEKKIRRFKGSL